MPEETFDLIIIGAGPGGYVAAIRAAQLGMKVAVVEKRDTWEGSASTKGASRARRSSIHRSCLPWRGTSSPATASRSTPPRLNLARMMARKDDVVKKLTDGVAFLFKKN